MQKERRIKVACIGDSITAGYGLDNPQTQSYPSILQQKLGDGYEVHNYGVNGTTLLRNTITSYAKTQECANALDFCADIAVIGLGTNDLLPGNIDKHESEFVKDYEDLIGALLSGNPNMRIYLLLPYCSKIQGINQDYMTKWHNRIQGFICQVATERGPAEVDVIKVLSEEQADDAYYVPDGVHPGPLGAELIASSIIATIVNR